MHHEIENRKTKHNQGFRLEVIGLASKIEVNRDLVRQLRPNHQPQSMGKSITIEVNSNSFYSFSSVESPFKSTSQTIKSSKTEVLSS